MKRLLRKDFCLWVVPSNDGRVRKIRFTFKRALMILGLTAFVAAGMFYVAGDYARMQFLRAKNLISLQLLTRQRDKLISQKQQLEGKMSDLEQINSKVLTYERNVRQRLDELSALIETAVDMGVIPSEDAARNKKVSEGGIGGAEVACEGPDCFAASEAPTSLIEGLGELGYQGDLVDQLDRYTTLLRTVPLGAPGDGHVSSFFGFRISPFSRMRGMHEGIDFSLASGSEIWSTADGVVRSVERTGTYGLVVDIAHSGEVVTRYAHLSEAHVKPGDKVCRGEAIGLVGSTGRSTGPHLHYEVRVGDRAVNPLPLMTLAGKLLDAL